MQFYSGVDLGEDNDYTALSIIETIKQTESGPLLHVRHLERFKDMLYHKQVMEVQQRLLRAPLWGRTELVVDATGPGRGAADLFQELDFNFRGVIIHGGERERAEQPKPEEGRKGMYHYVPKKTLVNAALIPFQQGRILISERLRFSHILKDELRGFRMKQKAATGHETFSHRSGEHDDLVLALALASWAAHRFGGGMPNADLAGAVTSYDPQPMRDLDDIYDRHWLG